MSIDESTKLSVNWPVLRTILAVGILLVIFGSIAAELYQQDLHAGNLAGYLAVGLFFYFGTGRFWFSPTVQFDGEGIYLKKFQEAVLFVPFSDVTRLKGINGYIFDSRSRFRRFGLYYKDAYGAERRIRIMLHYHQDVFESEPVLFQFLDLVESANKDFVYDNSPFGPARY